MPSRWSFCQKSTWGSNETTTIGKTHPMLLAGSPLCELGRYPFYDFGVYRDNELHLILLDQLFA